MSKCWSQIDQVLFSIRVWHFFQTAAQNFTPCLHPFKGKKRTKKSKRSKEENPCQRNSLFLSEVKNHHTLQTERMYHSYIKTKKTNSISRNSLWEFKISEILKINISDVKFVNKLGESKLGCSGKFLDNHGA